MAEKEVKESKPELKPIIVKRAVKHTFTREEREEMNVELLNQFDACKNAEAEFDSVKASYKAKISEAEAGRDTIASQLRAGFEMRQKECRVEFSPAEQKKRFYVVETGELAATEPMSSEDYQQDLIQAESSFELREEITLYHTGTDKGVLIVGRMKGKWFSALRMRLGTPEIQERLDSEQPCFKKRFDAIAKAAKRAMEWLKSQDKKSAEGFEDPILAIIEKHREREE